MPNSILTPAEVASFRALVQDIAMPDTFEVLRKTEIPDGMGGTTFTEAVTSSGPCALEAITGARAMRAALENVRAGIVLLEAPYLVNMPPGTDVTAQDRLRVNGTRVFQVMGVVDAGVWDMSTMASCKETVTI